MWQDFEGGKYWDELAEICDDISRAAGFRGVMRFQGNTVCICKSCTELPDLDPVAIAILNPTTKFSSRQYFWLYGTLQFFRSGNTLYP